LMCSKKIEYYSKEKKVDKLSFWANERAVQN